MRHFAARLASALARTDVATLRAGWWAARALRALRRRLPESGLRARVPEPPPLPEHAVVGVRGLTVFARATCLERSLLLQRWLAAHGRRHDVLVGVGGDTRRLAAHAWVEGYDPDAAADGYEVLTRVPAD